MITSRHTGSVSQSRNYVAILFAIATLSACDAPLPPASQDLTLQPLVQSVVPPNRILFIGNSFTYYNGGVDVHLRELVKAASPTSVILIDSLATPDQTVQGHVRSPLTEAALRRMPWDIVVVQGASYEPLERDTQESFGKHMELIADEIRSRGAEVALFMTWAYRSRPAMIDALASGYLKTGNDISALVVPVGLAWKQIGQQRSTADLYSDDRHPSIRGTYLAACVFYSALFGESPLGNSYHAGLPAADARYLQNAAMQTTKMFYGPKTATLAATAEESNW